ncbi:MAG: alcohol dehydrogenase catalytic domain-containing protein [Rhodoplanes sp.]
MAALFRASGAPLSIERITLDPPGPTEVLVRVAAVGLCRTDYHVMRGLDPRIHLKKFVVVKVGLPGQAHGCPVHVFPQLRSN